MLMHGSRGPAGGGGGSEGSFSSDNAFGNYLAIDLSRPGRNSYRCGRRGALAAFQAADTFHSPRRLALSNCDVDAQKRLAALDGPRHRLNPGAGFRRHIFRLSWTIALQRNGHGHAAASAIQSRGAFSPPALRVAQSHGQPCAGLGDFCRSKAVHEQGG